MLYWIYTRYLKNKSSACGACTGSRRYLWMFNQLGMPFCCFVDGMKRSMNRDLCQNEQPLATKFVDILDPKYLLLTSHLLAESLEGGRWGVLVRNQYKNLTLGSISYPGKP